MHTQNTIKYFAYVRKSSEGEERQALSIQSQIDKAKEIFGDLDIIEVLEEKHSAFKPYKRPVFENMIKRIEKGEAGGIIAWHPDRLSRNEIDASTVSYLVRTGVIKDLKFGSYNFDNSPEGIMMLQMALSQSQYYSSKLGKDVKRGLEQKFNMGWQPNTCPNGYMNVRKDGFSTIKIDKKRFKLIRQAFDLMLMGSYTAPQAMDKLNNEWGFKTKARKSKGLSRSSFYRILSNLFYAGIIEYDGKQKVGKHKPMITLDEYDRIQVILGKKGKPRQRVNNFAYSGLIHCANCGSLITADKKTKIIKSTKEQKTYVYYRCNRKKPTIKCHEMPIPEPNLEEQVLEMLNQYNVIPDFANLFDEIVADCQKDEINQDDIINNIQKDINKVKLEKTNLTSLACKGLINEEEFLEQKNNYKKEIYKLEQRVKEIKKGKNKSDEILDSISLMMRAKKRFEIGNPEEQKTIIKRLGSNRVLGSKTLLISANKWGGYFKVSISPYVTKYTTLELAKKPLTKAKNKALTLLCRDLRTGRDSNPQLPP